MSDTMTNVEIDDVLSSIRRLVSDGDKVKPDASPKDGRFVLTPAFRVFDERGNEARGPAVDAGSEVFRHAPLGTELSGGSEHHETAPTTVPEADKAATGDSEGDLSIESPAQDALESLQAAVESAEHAAPEAPAEPEPSAEFMAMENAWQEELARMQARRANIEASNEADVGASGAGAPKTATPRPATTLEARIAELEAAVNSAGEDWEPDGSEPDIDRPLSPRIFEVVDNTRDAAAPAPNTEVTDTEVHDTEATDTEVIDTEATDTEVIDTDAPAPTPADPVFSHAEPRPYLLSEPTMAQDDAHEAKAEVPTPAEDVDKAPSEPGFVSTRAEIVDDDDVYLDVDALRDMITDVVREELRGRMGETITRNVRRMVRQEISRAIARYDPD